MSQAHLVKLSFAVAACAIISCSALVAGQGIAQVRVVAGPRHYHGPCPGQIRFSAKIVVDRYPMTLNYQWERSDGARGPVRVVRIPSAATRSITAVDMWRTGTRGERAELWEKIRVRSGNADITSDPAVVTLACR
jgi:hypothetical protein